MNQLASHASALRLIPSAYIVSHSFVFFALFAGRPSPKIEMDPRYAGEAPQSHIRWNSWPSK